MRSGRESQTAVLVCMGRAAAHERDPATRFRDSTAIALLPDEARARVERFRAGTATGIAERLGNVILGKRAKMMVARTVAIDDVVRARTSPQIVILGAGLDGRAWRMDELRDSVVFEVDHPDSQGAKRRRLAVGGLRQTAREVRFVPVDFTRDSLDSALNDAGHDPAGETLWIWEGVVMYLTQAEIASTLEAIERRSALGSRIVVAYHAPALVLRLVGPLVRRLGEPLRSAFTPEAMRALLASYGFAVVQDDALPSIAARVSPDVGSATRALKHLRIAVSVRIARSR